MAGISLPAGNSGGGGVTSLNSQTGAVSITSNDASVTISAPGGNVDLSVASSGSSSFAKYIDSQTAGTAGGTFTSGAARTRPLTEDYDPDGIGSVSSNQVTLQAGTYIVHAVGVGHAVDKHQISWVSVSGDSVTVLGTIGNCANIGIHSQSTLKGRFVLTQESVFELQHECTLTKATDGFGEAGNLNTEIFAFVELEKVA